MFFDRYMCFSENIYKINLWIISFELFCRRIVIELGLDIYQRKIISVRVYDNECGIWHEIEVYISLN